MEEVGKEKEYGKRTYTLWEEVDPRRTVKLCMKAMLMSGGINRVFIMSRADFMAKVLFEDLKVDMKDLICVVAFDNFKPWNITFWKCDAYEVFWAL